MKIVYRGSLQRTMIIYFLLIGFASLLIEAEFIFDIHSNDLRTELIEHFDKLSNGDIHQDADFQPIQSLRNKSVLMVVLFLIVVLILLTMFMKTITEPLQHMIDISKLIALGDLSQTVSIRARNELAEMGNTVNELTTNLQEILLLSKDMCMSVDQIIGEISDGLRSQKMDQKMREDLQHKINLLHSRTKLMNDIISHCKFYGVGR